MGMGPKREALISILHELEGWDFEAFPEYVLCSDDAAILKDHLQRWNKTQQRKDEYYQEHKEEKNQRAKERYYANKGEIAFKKKKHYILKSLNEKGIWK